MIRGQDDIGAKQSVIIDFSSVLLFPWITHRATITESTQSEVDNLVLEAVCSFLLPAATGLVCFAVELDTHEDHDHYSL